MSDKMHRLVVIEDDSPTAAALVRTVKGAGFDVELALDGTSGLQLIRSARPDLVILDLNLPDADGLDVLQQIVAQTSSPVIVLTARRDLEDRLRCFGFGADDFVQKPFWPEELIARIKRRLQVQERSEVRAIRFDAVLIDLDNRSVWIDGQEVSFSPQEFAVLVYLAERPNRSVSREQLASVALPSNRDRDTRIVDAYIARIRRKLGPSGGRISTVWRLGYRFATEAPTPS